MLRLIYMLMAALLWSHAAEGADIPVPRTVIALYDKEDNKSIKETLLHRMAEMPLNHLGITLEYHDIHQLPDIRNRPEVRGVISWLSDRTRFDAPEQYIAWGAAVMDSGKKFVVLGSFGFYQNKKNQATPITSINHFMRKLGMFTTNYWVNITYDAKVDMLSPTMFNVSSLDGIHPAYEHITVINEDATAHMVANKKSMKNSVLMVTNPRGGYIAEGYAYVSKTMKEGEVRQWVVNPFEFFRLVFATDDLPKPDTTTIAGRRIYYSHIDGDGFNNFAALEQYKDKPVIAAQVIMDHAIKPYPDLPVSATVIAADIDPDWAAVSESRAVARELFALPNVEAGSHTYSHPFAWEYFADGNAQKEVEYLKYYPHGGWKNQELLRFIPAFLTRTHSMKKLAAGKDHEAYERPRAYANAQFDIDKEISGSVSTLQELLPEHKKISLITWSGNCEPFEKAIKLSRMAGIENINGGDSRLDREYPSYASVAPIGLAVGNERQIYASTSNENTYTDLWRDRFFGFKYLIQTNRNTETPVRIKPLNIYYHFYSGEKQASLNALIENLNYARSQPIAPITARNFSAIASGFYSTAMIKTGEASWRIRNRGELQTIRFDRSTGRSVDFEASHGVIGQRYYQGSLYVYLDEAEETPVVALKPVTAIHAPPSEASAYLIESRWKVGHLQQKDGSISFTTQGFGHGDMMWQVPENGRYKISISGIPSRVVDVHDRMLHLSIADTSNYPHSITMKRIEK